MYKQNFLTPIGNIVIQASQKGITSIEFNAPVAEQSNPITQLGVDWLTTYFKGAVQTNKLPIDIHGTTFRMKVWETLLQVPYGQTWSYEQLAKESGYPKGARAIGQAVHFNPLGIYIPCHRIIGKDGSLTGYAGGLHYKVWLLNHEKRKREDY